MSIPFFLMKNPEAGASRTVARNVWHKESYDCSSSHSSVDIGSAPTSESIKLRHCPVGQSEASQSSISKMSLCLFIGITLFGTRNAPRHGTESFNILDSPPVVSIRDKASDVLYPDVYDVKVESR